MKKTLFDDAYVTIESEKGIVIGIFKTDFVDIKVAEHLVNKRVEITNNKSCALLADIKRVKNVTKEARDFFASEKGCVGIIATALLIDSPLGSMIGNFYINISRPLRPVKIFVDESKAKKWLDQYLERTEFFKTGNPYGN